MMQNDVKAYDPGIDGSQLCCVKCGCELESRRVTLDYMGHNFSVVLPCCAVCGQIFISKELAQGKMLAVETLLEDK